MPGGCKVQGAVTESEFVEYIFSLILRMCVCVCVCVVVIRHEGEREERSILCLFGKLFHYLQNYIYKRTQKMSHWIQVITTPSKSKEMMRDKVQREIERINNYEKAWKIQTSEESSR